jgi:hypothetical protein
LIQAAPTRRDRHCYKTALPAAPESMRMKEEAKQQKRQSLQAKCIGCLSQGFEKRKFRLGEFSSYCVNEFSF